MTTLHRALFVAGAFVSLPLLTGCQTSCTGDARFDGYYCARGNISNGTYQGQTAALERTAIDRQGEAASLRRQYEVAQDRLRAAKARRATTASELIALEGEVESLRRAVARASG